MLQASLGLVSALRMSEFDNLEEKKANIEARLDLGKVCLTLPSLFGQYNRIQPALEIALNQETRTQPLRKPC